MAGTVILVPIAALFSRPDAWPALPSLLALAALGLGGTGLAYVLYFWLIAEAGPTRTLTVTYLLPITAVIYGAVFLSESVVWREIAGMALILAGISGTSGLIRLRRRQLKPDQPSEPMTTAG
ncbi:MAG TPA: DMT family transporter [Chloroflexota bacterium]|nr:DMT family transporter [Chloroflexota bacterium]